MADIIYELNKGEESTALTKLGQLTISRMESVGLFQSLEALDNYVQSTYTHTYGNIELWVDKIEFKNGIGQRTKDFASYEYDYDRERLTLTLDEE